MSRTALTGLLAFACDQASKVGDGIWRTSIESLAEDFRNEFDCPPAASLEWMMDLCSARLGIDVEYRAMPMKGYHHAHSQFGGGRRKIFLPQSASEYQTRTTIIHELGEIVEEEIEAIIGRSVENKKSERWWDSFAHAVLLPEAWFHHKLLETEFDLVGLQKQTRLSYPGILIRTKDVCNVRYPLFTLLFEQSHASTSDSLHLVRISATTWQWQQHTYDDQGTNLFRLPRQGGLTPLGPRARHFLIQKTPAVLHVTSEPSGFECVVRLLVPTTNPAAGRLVMIGMPISHSRRLTMGHTGDLIPATWTYALPN